MEKYNKIWNLLRKWSSWGSHQHVCNQKTKKKKKWCWCIVSSNNNNNNSNDQFSSIFCVCVCVCAMFKGIKFCCFSHFKYHSFIYSFIHPTHTNLFIVFLSLFILFWIDHNGRQNYYYHYCFFSLSNTHQLWISFIHSFSVVIHSGFFPVKIKFSFFLPFFFFPIFISHIIWSYLEFSVLMFLDFEKKKLSLLDDGILKLLMIKHHRQIIISSE